MTDSWISTTLGQVALVNPKEPPLTEDCPFVPMDAVDPGQKWIRYTEPRGTRSGARARGGDVLFARITPCLENGKTAQVPYGIDRCGGSTEFIVLRGTEQILSDFLFVWTTDSNVRRIAAGLMTGSTGRQRLSAKDLAAMQIQAPPVAQQRRIVDLIGSIDTYIDSLEGQIDATRTARDALRDDVLLSYSGGIDTVALADVATASWGNTEVTKKAYAASGYTAYSASGPDGLVDWFEHDKPAIVMSAIGAQCGKTWLAEGKWTAIKNTIWIRGESDELTRYLFIATGDPAVWPKRGQAQPFVSLGDVRSLQIALPPAEKRTQIVELFGSIESARRNLSVQVESIRRLRQGILSDLLSGERLLDDSYDMAVGL